LKLRVPIGIRGVVPILIMVLRPVRVITIAIVSIVGGLILRIEATTMTTTVVEATSTCPQLLRPPETLESEECWFVYVILVLEEELGLESSSVMD